MRKLLVVGLIGCGPVQAPRAASEPAHSNEPIYEVPASPPLPSWQVSCSQGTSWSRRMTAFTFPNEPIEPVTWGPRVANRSRRTASRSSLQLETALRRDQGDITECWKWAAARGAPATRIDLAVTVDPFGRTSELSLVSATPNTELVGCVSAMLRDFVVTGFASHTSRMHATLEFSRADQPAWKHLPSRPDPREPARFQRACTAVLDHAPLDRVAAPAPLIVSDEDPSRLAAANEVVVYHRCTIPRWPTIDRTSVRAAFATNLGAFRTCYAEALARDHSLTGLVTVRATFEPGGLPTNVSADGDGDPTLHACMASAAREIWIDDAPLDRILHISYPFLLEAAPAIPTKLEALLAWGDGDTALAIAAFDVRTARDPISACRGRANVVRALAARAPWRDDARTHAALRELGAFVSAMDAAAARTCLDDASDGLRDLVLPMGDRSTLTLEAARPLARHVSWGAVLQLAVAEELSRGARRDEGLAALRTIEREADPALADDVRARIAQITARRDLAVNSCR
jgi:hypothetical protein